LTKLALTNARVIIGDGSMHERATVLVSGSTVEEVVPSSQMESPPEGYEVVDCSGKTIMPGIIDVHIHMVGGNVLGHSLDYPSTRRLGEPIAMQAYRTYDAGRTVLQAGVTTVRGVGDRDFIDVAYKQAEEAGLIDGPTMVPGGLGITMTGGHVHARCAEVDGPQEIRKEVRRQIKLGAESIKIMGITGGMSTAGQNPADEQFTYEEISAAVNEAHRLGRITASHCHGIAGIRNAVRAGVRTLGHGTYMDDEVAQEMAGKDIYFVPTLTSEYMRHELMEQKKLSEPLMKRYQAQAVAGDYPTAQDKMAVALRNGVKIVTGTDCGGNAAARMGTNPLELWALVDCGMSEMDAIVAGTGRAAEAIKVDDRLGTLKPGLYADLLVVDGNPLEDLSVVTHRNRHIDAVMKKGRWVPGGGQPNIE